MFVQEFLGVYAQNISNDLKKYIGFFFDFSYVLARKE